MTFFLTHKNKQRNNVRNGLYAVCFAMTVFLLSSCTSSSPYISTPPENAKANERKIFLQVMGDEAPLEPRENLKKWQDFTAKHPGSYASHNNLGVAYVHVGDLDQALMEFKKAMHIRPLKKIRKNLVWVERRRLKTLLTEKEKTETELNIPEASTYEPLDEEVQNVQADEDRFVGYKDGKDILEKPNLKIKKNNREKTFHLTRKEAAILGLQRDFDLSLEFINPQLSSAAVTKQLATFDPTVSSSYTTNSSTERNSSSLNTSSPSNTTTQNSTFAAQVTQRYFPGTELTLKYDLARATSKPQSGNLANLFSSDIILEAKQSLLRNFGVDINTTRIRLAKNTREQSVTDFINRALQVAASVQNIYWDLYLNVQNLKVRQESLDLNQDLFKRKKREVELGALAPVQLVAIEADLATRRSDVVSAKRQLAQAEINFKKALNIPFDFNGDIFKVVPVDAPEVVKPEFDRDEVLGKAMKYRNDLTKLILSREAKMMEVGFNKNQLLPDLTLSGNYGFLNRSPTFGGGLAPVDTAGRTQYEVKLEVSYPIWNRNAKSDYVTNKLQLQQIDINVRKKKQEIASDISLALNNVENTYQLYLVTEESTRVEEKRLEAEEKKLRFGQTIIRTLLDAQNTLTNQRLRLLQSKVDYRKALTDLYLKQGLFEPDLSVDIKEVKAMFKDKQ